MRQGLGRTNHVVWGGSAYKNSQQCRHLCANNLSYRSFGFLFGSSLPPKIRVSPSYQNTSWWTHLNRMHGWIESNWVESSRGYSKDKCYPSAVSGHGLVAGSFHLKLHWLIREKERQKPIHSKEFNLTNLCCCYCLPLWVVSHLPLEWFVDQFHKCFDR